MLATRSGPTAPILSAIGLILLLGSGRPAAQLITAPHLEPRTHLLSNGLRVVLLEDHSTPITTTSALLGLCFEGPASSQPIGGRAYAASLPTR